ncbi:MAG: ATP-binding protein, partial [Clostridia bacterium]|nr:ATP-binding protein [Clostridia bacterium]
SSRVYIQSAYSSPDEEKRAQEARSFRRIDDSFKKIIVTRDTAQPWYDDKGILTVSIYDFLLDRSIIEK